MSLVKTLLFLSRKPGPADPAGIAKTYAQPREKEVLGQKMRLNAG